MWFSWGWVRTPFPPLDPRMKTHSSDVLLMVWRCACHVLWTLSSNYFLCHFLWTCDPITGWYLHFRYDFDAPRIWSRVWGVGNCWGVCPLCYNDQTPHSGVLPVQRPSENTAAATQLFMLKISTWGYLQTLPVVSPFSIIQWWLVCNFNPSFARFCDLCEKYLRKCRRTIILAGLFGSYTAKLATGTWLSCDF